METVGLGNAGKTTVLYRIRLGEAVSTRPTMGSNVEEVTKSGVRLEVWDLGGQVREISNQHINISLTHHVAFMIIGQFTRNVGCIFYKYGWRGTCC